LLNGFAAAIGQKFDGPALRKGKIPLSGCLLHCGDIRGRQVFHLVVLMILIFYVIALVPLGGYGLLETVASISVITGAAAFVADRRPVRNPLADQV
jgi:hypothetical protein